MKQLILATAILTMFAGSIVAQTGSRLKAESRYLPGGPTLTLMPLDSSVHVYHDTLSVVDSQKYVYQFNGTGWTHIRKFDYTYNAADKLIKMEYKNWNAAGSVYVNGGFTHFFLNPAGYCIKDSNRLWIPANNAYRDNVRNIYTLNAAGQVLEKIYDSWDFGANSLFHTYRYVNTYNALGKPLTALNQEWDASIQWYDHNLTTWVYDATDSNLLTVTGKQDVTTPGILVNVYQNVFTLNANGSIASYLLNNWNNGTSSFSTPSMKITISYDANGNNILETIENWDMPSSSYKPYYQMVRTYNSFKQKTSETRNMWNNTTSTYDNPAQKDNWYYEPYITGTTTGIGTEPAPAASLSLSPIPTTGQLNITLNWEEPQAFTAIITDMNGRVCNSFSAAAAKEYKGSTDLSALPAGNYILTIKGQRGANVSQRIMVAR